MFVKLHDEHFPLVTIRVKRKIRAKIITYLPNILSGIEKENSLYIIV